MFSSDIPGSNAAEVGHLKLSSAAAGIVGNGAAVGAAVVAVDVATCVLHSPLGRGELSDAVVGLAFGVGGLAGLVEKGCLMCKRLGQPELKKQKH